MLFLSKFSHLMTKSSYNFRRSLHHHIYNASGNGNLAGQQNKTMSANASYSVWDQLSESDKLQSALDTDEPENAEVAYYKGLAFKDFGHKYSGHAMAAFRHALSLCGPKDVGIKERCESEVQKIEQQDNTPVIPSEQLTQLQNEIDHLKALILGVQRSVDQLVRKVDGA